MFYSYDIFDTILYRRVPKSSDVFFMMEKQPQLCDIWPDSKGSFGKCRKSSEFWLRHTRRHEITIEEIYEEVKRRSGIDEKTKEMLIDIEYQLEVEQSFLNNYIVDEIEQLILNNEQVVLVSDMYWHEKQLYEWLISKNKVFEKIRIYVSCDCHATKSKGTLFEVVKKRENVNYKEWLHKGDNKKSDGIIPARYGISTVIVSGGTKYDFEKKIGHDDMQMLATYGLIAEARKNSNGYAYDLGVSVAAPMIYEYVEWVLKQALKNKISKLYFVLRDGYIPKIIADIIIKNRNLPLTTEFIFGSRVAWRFPEITIEKLKNLSVWETSNWVFRDPAVAYVPFERLGFSKDKINELFGENFGSQKIYKFSEFKEVLRQALNNSYFVENLQKNIEESGFLLNEYLTNTLDFTVPFAIIDTNSTGKTQKDLQSFLNKKNDEIHELIFFYHTYLSKDEPNFKTQIVFYKATETDRRLPEAFFRAPYNQCYGYTKIDNKIEPKFKENVNCSWNVSFDYDSYLRGIISFTESMEQNSKEELEVGKYVQLLLKVVNFEVISSDVIKQAAVMPFNPDMNGNEILDFYPTIKLSAVLHPFSELIYYPKGSYYNAGKLWIILYKILYLITGLKRNLKE